ncbi:MAG: VWA domain-containing protein [Planctomycetes bacterium]|nr:VWA domain-containing protein [Planctomycetota bacterium]
MKTSPSTPSSSTQILALLLQTFAAAAAFCAFGWAAVQQGDVAVARTAVVPQTRPIGLTGAGTTLQMTWVGARVRIVERVAETEFMLALTNGGATAEEAVLLVPAPDGATVRSFNYEVVPDGTQQGVTVTQTKPIEAPSARLLPADVVRNTYESIVRQSRDPGLLEFAGFSLIRSSVFPVPARATLKVKLVYEQVLGGDGDRVDYILPRSEAVSGTHWTFTAQVQSKREIEMVYSPNHRLKTTKAGANTTLVEIDPEDKNEGGAFQLSFLMESEGPAAKSKANASFMTHADPSIGGGYFMMMAGLPADAASEPKQLREVTIVIDRSGSMAGEKIEQVREGARQVIEGLLPGEYFNIIDYSDAVEQFAPGLVVKNDATMAQAREYLNRLRAQGGTNIHGALLAALKQPVTPNALPMLLFLTDGLPTVGITDEKMIRDAAIANNPGARRLFTFGVGHDVNAPLLDGLANQTRGYSTFVHPKENVEQKVGQVAKRLTSPLLTKAKIEVIETDGTVSTRRTRDVLPSEMPDIFEDDRLVVLGQYFGDEPMRFRLSGESRGAKKSYEFTMDPKRDGQSAISSISHAFIPRLWANKKIGALVDEVRLATGKSPVAGQLANDPRTKEVVDEIVTLSTRFGVLSEYTAFFANEPVDLSQKDNLHARLQQMLASRAVGERTGQGSVAQAVNIQRQRRQNTVNRNNTYLDGQLKEVRLSNIQQKADRALFRRGVTWVDSRVFEQKTGKSLNDPPDATVDFGSQQYFDLARKLITEGRPGILAANGQLLLFVEGKRVLVKAPA